MLNTSAPQLLVKAPAERRYYSMDFSALMDSDETIISINSITSEKRGGDISNLLIDGTGINGQTVEMYISSGTDYSTYRVEVQITTSDSNILQGDGLLKVSDK